MQTQYDQLPEQPPQQHEQTRFDWPATAQDEITARLSRFTTTDAAEYFGVTASTIRNWIKDGCILAEDENKSGKTGRAGRYIIDISELQRIDREGRLMLAETRKVWVRMLWRKRGKTLPSVTVTG